MVVHHFRSFVDLWKSDGRRKLSTWPLRASVPVATIDLFGQRLTVAAADPRPFARHY